MARNTLRCLLRVAVLAQLAVWGVANAQTANDQDWPRQLDSQAGTLVVYEPQPDTFQGQTLTGRAAFSLTPKGKTDQVFGAMWFSANVSTDRDSRMVQVLSGKVTRLDLPDSSAETQQTLTALIEQELPKVSLSLDTVTAALAENQQQKATGDELKAEPPKILFATEPTVLVLLDGQPIRQPIEKSGIEAVVNTPFPLFFDPKSKLYYLTNGAIWYQTGDVLKGPWQVIPAPPQEVAAVVTKGDKKDQGEPAAADATPPRIVVATEPTELVVTKGPPNLAPVSGTQLLQVTNADESIFRDITSQEIFMVLSGRWYTAKTFEGPWTFVASDQLPAEFAKIPPASSAGNVLAFVSGTPQANQAVADAEIPQTAEIKRDAPPPPITYDGQPDFQPVAGGAPGVSYAVNSPSSVLMIQGTYYAVVNAVWYMAPGPQGPWSVATSVPQEVQTIPPASPVYNVRYVTIYQATPTIVYTGYTPGYLGCYRWHGTVVYGTGYVYRPWVSAGVYYPRPVTWGFNVGYNPYTGWSYGVGPSAVFLYYGATWGGAYYRPPWRPLYGGAWYGPGGYRPPPARFGGGWYSPGYRAAYYHPGGPYYGGRPGYGGAWARPGVGLYHRPEFAHAVVQRPFHPVAMGHPAGPAYRSGRVVADRNGNVLRQNSNGSWQQHDNRAGWKPASAPGPGGRPGVSGSPAHAVTPVGSAAHGVNPAGGHGVTPGAPGGAHATTAVAPGGAHAVTPGTPGGHPVTPVAPGGAHAVTPGTPAGAHAVAPVVPGGAHAVTPGTPAGGHAVTPVVPGAHPGTATNRPPQTSQTAHPPGTAAPPGSGSHAGPPGAQNKTGGNKPANHPPPKQNKKE